MQHLFDRIKVTNYSNKKALQSYEEIYSTSVPRRDKIYIGLCEQKTVTEIAKELGRHKSTISREIKRNGDKIGYLYPGKAHEAALARRNKNVSKIDKNKKLKSYIILHLKQRWSPNTIAGRWNLVTPLSK